MTPFLAASCSIFAPEAGSRLTIIRTLILSASICRAMVCILLAEPPAFWMLQSRLYFAQSALSAVGSAVTQRGEDVVSGRMIPTFAPLPSTVPLAEELDSLAEAEEDDEAELLSEPLELLLSSDEPQAVRDIAAAIPSTASDTLVLPMRCGPFRGGAASGDLRCCSPMRSDCCGREHIAVTAVTARSDTNSLRNSWQVGRAPATSPGKTVTGHGHGHGQRAPRRCSSPSWLSRTKA